MKSFSPLTLLLLCCCPMAIVLGHFPGIKNSSEEEENSSNSTREERCERARKLVGQINGQEIGEGKWQANFHERFASMNATHRRRMQGLIHMALPSSPSSASSNSSSQTSQTSKNSSSSSSNRRKRSTTCSYKYAFDARAQWPNCSAIIGNIRDQSGCGGCWAVASASVFTDRYCIQRLKSGVSTSATNASNFFSEADVLSCSPNSYGCDGGSLYYAFQYMKSSGVVTGTNYTWSSGCKPYPFPPNSASIYSAPSCSSSSCTNSKWTTAYSSDRKYASSTSYLQGSSSTVAAIQAEIKANGPVVASMDVYYDFFFYSSGVYKQTSSTYEGGHAVRLLGWGTQSCSDGTTQAFWLAANSWNTDWGMKGFFLIAQGSDECGIESQGIFYGTPKI